MSTTTVSRATSQTIGQFIAELKSGKQLRMTPTNAELLFQYIQDFERGLSLVVLFCDDGKTLFRKA
jgi:hypothetical protein